MINLGIFRPPGMEEQLEDPECDSDRVSVGSPHATTATADRLGEDSRVSSANTLGMCFESASSL